MNWSGTWHPLAERFPMLSEDELREMAASITERGQYVPCRMDPQGLGLDGRNRVAACALAGVEPLWEIYDGDPIAFIVEVNADRRHLTTGQRAMAVAIGLDEAGLRKDGRFKRGSVPPPDKAQPEDYWGNRVALAGVVLDHARELVDEVLHGDLELGAAHRRADDVRKARARIDALGGDLAALVDNGVIDVVEAERRADEEKRIGVLAGDLAERVRGGTLTLDEAELIQTQNERQVDEWAARVRAGLDVLGRMAGHPIPGGISRRLTDPESEQLAAVLDVLEPFKEGVAA